ncbi:LysR family transcriptional regulator [Paenibacillus sp. GCM10027627]|uniref:LysR family transcriptional regulator n=1 Tax=unclassified Paenibacillus TaxID=185978 RepID=UPI00362A211B
MINLELYRVFFFAAQEGSISKAAQRLHITQPSASLAVKQLEESLQTTLFHRSTRGVSLTNEGQTLFTYIEQAYELIMSAESKMDEVASLNGGEVRIAASISVIEHILLPHMKAFHRLYPDIKIKIEHHSTHGCLKLLREGKIDFCVVRLPVRDEAFEETKLLSIQDCFVTGEKYKHLAEEAVSLKELAQYPLIVFPAHMTSRKAMDRFLASHGIALAPSLEIGSLQLLVGFAQANLGISYVIGEFVAKELAAGSLYKVKVEEPIPKVDLGIVRMKSFAMSAAAQRFLDLMNNTDEKEIIR